MTRQMYRNGCVIINKLIIQQIPFSLEASAVSFPSFPIFLWQFRSQEVQVSQESLWRVILPD